MDRQLAWVFKHKVTGVTASTNDGSEFSRLNPDYECLGLGAVEPSPSMPLTYWEVNDLVAKFQKVLNNMEPESMVMDGTTVSQLIDLVSTLKGLNHSSSFYETRCNAMQREINRFREPERTILCDILANGKLLPDPKGSRYGTTGNQVMKENGGNEQ